ncbi:MAG TPA: malonic semialdehyde reductase [Propionibacteriaceae bacterium]|nr:malonic semialdehyde reductase [Propionibacteriaceae bacterium]
MTQLDSSLDFAAYEAELASHLVLDQSAQDLLFREARSANAFTDEPVTDAQLQAIYELAKWGPTAMNGQPLRIVAVRSAEARARLVPHMAGGNQARTATAPLVVILAADYDFHDEFHKTFPVFPGARDVFADESSRIETATLSATLQIGYLTIAIRAAGLAAGPMTGFDADGVTREFFPDGRHRALVVMNIGHPAADGFRPRQPRLDYEDAVVAV